MCECVCVCVREREAIQPPVRVCAYRGNLLRGNLGTTNFMACVRVRACACARVCVGVIGWANIERGCV